MRFKHISDDKEREYEIISKDPKILCSIFSENEYKREEETHSLAVMSKFFSEKSLNLKLNTFEKLGKDTYRRVKEDNEFAKVPNLIIDRLTEKESYYLLRILYIIRDEKEINKEDLNKFLKERIKKVIKEISIVK